MTATDSLAAQQELQARNNGRAANALYLEMISQREELIARDQLQPATVLNFNPIGLRITGNIEMSVPPCNDPMRPEDMRIFMEFNGRKHPASYVVVREARFWPRITGVERDSQSDEDVAQHTIAHLLPIGIVHQFHMHYTTGTRDSTGMGGVLCYQGDRHTLDPRHIAANQGNILVPVRNKLRNGRFTYSTRPEKLKTALERLFMNQRNYCDQQLQQAQALFDGGEQERRNITRVHRIWGQYAIDMGWKPKWADRPPSWLTESLGDDVAQQQCVYCQATSERPDAHFCQNCNAPYDAHRSFMAGLHVPMAYLQTLRGEQRAEVLRELKARQEGFDAVGAGEPEPEPTRSHKKKAE